MPVTLVDDPSVFPDIQAPVAGDGRDAVSVAVPFQRLANRTRQTKNRIDAIAPSTDGVRVLRTVASIAALQAIGAVDHLDGSYAVVEDYGLYRYDIDSLQTAATPFVVQPTDVVGGGTPGRWHLCAAGKSALDAANGIPQLDSAGRIAAPKVRNGIIAIANSGLVLRQQMSVGFIDIGGSAQITLANVQVGDTIMLDYVASIISGTSNTAELQVFMLAPTSANNAAITETNAQVRGADSWAGVAAGSAVFTAAESGSFTLKMQSRSPGFNATFQINNLRGIVVRG